MSTRESDLLISTEDLQQIGRAQEWYHKHFFPIQEAYRAGEMSEEAMAAALTAIGEAHNQMLPERFRQDSE